MTGVPGELLEGDEEFALDPRTAALAVPGSGLLSARLARPWPIPEFLELACALTQAVTAMHARGIVHRDLQPQHVFIEPAPLRARLCGFGVAARLSREHPSLKPAPELIGSFTYVAPEQTGRLNRSVDFRSDLYALGVMLYELLSGRLPFSASTPAEWIQSHVARAPAALDAALPAQLAAIVEKLLAKAPEDRYQSARGLTLDLARCRNSWQALSRIESFPLGSGDFESRLSLPHRLYGRQTDSARLASVLAPRRRHG